MTQHNASNSYIPSNGSNRPVTHLNNSANNYIGHGLKRMRGDDFRADGMSAPHRMKWDSNDDEKNLNFLERHDVDQRSEIYGQYTNITLNETSVLCFTIHNPKYPITLVNIQKIFNSLSRIEIWVFSFRMSFERFVLLPVRFYAFQSCDKLNYKL